VSVMFCSGFHAASLVTGSGPMSGLKPAGSMADLVRGAADPNGLAAAAPPDGPPNGLAGAGAAPKGLLLLPAPPLAAELAPNGLAGAAGVAGAAAAGVAACVHEECVPYCALPTTCSQ
jgi:hypothetical protein